MGDGEYCFMIVSNDEFLKNAHSILSTWNKIQINVGRYGNISDRQIDHVTFRRLHSHTINFVPYSYGVGDRQDDRRTEYKIAL